MCLRSVYKPNLGEDQIDTSFIMHWHQMNFKYSYRHSEALKNYRSSNGRGHSPLLAKQWIGQVQIREEPPSAKGYFYYPEVSNYPIATWNSPTLLALLSTSTDISVVLNASVVPCHSLRGAWGIGLIPHPHTRIQDPGRGVALEGSQQGL